MSNTAKRILVVDGRNGAESESNGRGYQIETVGSREALDRIGCGPVPDLILVDSLSDDDGGLGILTVLRQCQPSVPVFLLSPGSEPLRLADAVDSEGSVKPFSAVISRGLNGKQLGWTAALETHEVADPIGDDRFFVAASPAMLQLRDRIRQLSSVDVPVLCLGESGSGKEVVARLIHRWSRRAKQVFLKVNCAALPSELLESELFGYERGAFTGAERSKPGKFELSNGGSILLDEIAEISTALQAKLLHVLQDQEFTRLGGRSRTKINIRVLAATNIDVKLAIADKSFREDLYYRLGAFVLRIPPLRERREDIPVLLLRFTKHYATKHNLPPRAITKEVLDHCCRYDWPGNVRELENFARRYLILGEPFPETANDNSSAMSPPAPYAAQCTGGEGFKSTIRALKSDAEVSAIRRALDETNWNRKAAAGLLRMSYKSLLSKLRQYGLVQTLPLSADTPHVPGQSDSPTNPAHISIARAAGSHS